MTSDAFFAAVEQRRTYYGLTPTSPISDKALQAIVEKAILYGPTAFNAQQARAVLVTGEINQKLWKVVEETYLKTLGGDKAAVKNYGDKIRSFTKGYGTVIFLDDENVINGMAGKLPALATAFPIWAQNSAGIVQYIVWTALEAEGFGASLQHYAQYSPETQTEVNKLLDVPQTWKISGFLPFGIPSSGPGYPGKDKEFQPIEERVKVIFD